MAAKRLGIIAGAGRFPLHIATQAQQQGCHVSVAALKGWADVSLFDSVDAVQELSIGQFGALIAWFKEQQVDAAIMAGKVTKEVLFAQKDTFDPQLLQALASAKDASVNALLGAVAQSLMQQGIQLLDSSLFLQSALAPAEVITDRAPNTQEQQDIQVGLQAARALATLDVGQTVIVRQGVVVAVEALEGTDAAIRRAHALAKDHLVVVKTASPTQDRRFDLPCIGTDTLKVFHECGVTCLAVEAGSTLLLDKDQILKQAQSQGLSIVGVDITATATQ